MMQGKWLSLMLVLILSVLLSACPRPLSLPVGGDASSLTGAESDHVSGRISFGFRSVQATIKEDVAPGATVSLIDVKTGNTVSTTVTNVDGRFVLKYSNGFKPKVNDLYYFEAVKGLSGAAGSPNAVGADSVRVRTIASFRRGGWVTLTSSSAGSLISITPMTTALAIAVSLRSTTNRPIPADTLFGAIRANGGSTPDTVTPPDPSLVPPTFIQEIYALVLDSLAKERDPMRWIRLAPGQTNSALLPDVPFSFIDYWPSNEAPAGGELTLVGSNFASTLAENLVYFTTAEGTSTVASTVLEINADATRLKVRVPLDAVSGQVTLVIADKSFIGPIFRLAIRDGHSVVDLAGKIYVANQRTVSVIEPLGGDKTAVSTLIPESQLAPRSPRALTFGPGGYSELFVALAGVNPEVRKFDVNNPTTSSKYHGAGSVPNPSGMAFRYSTRALYLTDAVTGKLYVIASQGAAVGEVSLSAPLSSPRGLSFGPDGKLYVANSGDGTVVAIDLDTTPAKVTPFAEGLATPWGVAFDNRGSFYVSNNSGNSIFTRQVTEPPGEPIAYGALTSFASIPTPGGLDADSSGYVYVADNVSNGVYRVNSGSESRQVGFGISSPTSVWADSDGLFVLTDAGRLLKIEWGDSERLSVYAEGLQGALGLVRHTGKFYTIQRPLQQLTRIYADGSTDQALYPVNPYLWSSPTLQGDQMYLRRVTSDVTWKVREHYDSWSIGLGQVDTFNLANLQGVPSAEHKGLKRKPIAVAADLTDEAAYKGVYYILDGDGLGASPNILRLERFNTSGTMDTGATSMTVPFFIDQTTRARLVDPQDIAVDSDGKIWVADDKANAGSGAILVFKRDGSFEKLIAETKPARLAKVGDQIAVSSHQANGYVRFYDKTGTPTRTFRGFNLPLGATVSGDGDLYVHSRGDADKVYRIPNYTTVLLDGNKEKTFTALELAPQVYYTLTDRDYDIDWDDTLATRGLVFARSTSAYGYIYRYIEAENRIVNTFAHYSYFYRLSRTRNGKFIAPGIYGEMYHTDYGSHSTVLYQSLVTRQASDVNANHYPPSQGNAMAVVLPGSMVVYSSTYRNAYLIETDLTGTWEKAHNVSNMSAITHGGGYVYVARSHGNGVVQRWTPGKDAPRNAWFRDLTGTANYTGSRSVGLAFHNNKVYQSLLDYHVIREIDPTNPAAPVIKVLNAGLTNPEL